MDGETSVLSPTVEDPEGSKNRDGKDIDSNDSWSSQAEDQNYQIL
jgi:hypothetical protein